jgi:hypothetical protein
LRELLVANHSFGTLNLNFDVFRIACPFGSAAPLCHCSSLWRYLHLFLSVCVGEMFLKFLEIFLAIVVFLGLPVGALVDFEAARGVLFFDGFAHELDDLFQNTESQV